MSTEVENRVLNMTFNNGSFEKGVAKTMSTLDALKSKLNFTGAAKGLQDLQGASSNFNLAGMAKGIDDINHRFSVLNLVGIGALTNIVNKAATAGAQMVKSFTISPITDGFNQYQQQINATQTILANTAQSGGNLKNVTATLATLNDYANKTIYNFSDMATNLGTFTSAGVKLVPASQAIQGLSNIAAAAGASTQSAAGAMYQLSQALGRGKVNAQDWNSVVAAGMASSNFKSSILETAKALGTLKIPKTESVAQWEKAGNSFQSAMSSGQITSAVLIQTLQTMTGNMTDAQLAAKGYTKEQIKSLQAMAQQAKAAAVNVKTARALIDNLRQGVGSSYAQVFKTLIGDLPTATKLFTGLSGVLNNIFVTPVDRLNAFLVKFVKLGGMVNITNSVKNAFNALLSVLKPINLAFRDIFPKTSVVELLAFSRSLVAFTKGLKLNEDTADNLRHTLRGLFAIFDIVHIVVDSAVGALVHLFKALSGRNKDVLGFTGHIGDLVYNFDQMLHRTNDIGKFFNGFTNLLIVPINYIKEFVSIIKNMFSGFNTKSLNSTGTAFGNFAVRLAALNAVADRVHSIFGKLGVVFDKVGLVIGTALKGVGEKIAEAFSSENFSKVLDTINTGLLAGIVVLLTKFVHSGIKLNTNNGFFGQLNNTLGQLNGTLQSLQTSVKSSAILKIAEALALLTVSIVAISLINSKDLTRAMVAIAVGFAGMDLALKSLASSTGIVGSAKLPLITAALIGLGASLILMATALKILASIKPEDTGRSLLNMASLLFIAIKAMRSLSKDSTGLISASVALGIFSGALVILAGALKLFSLFKWDQMIHGFAALSGALLIIALAMKAMPKNMFVQAAALVAVGVALNAIAAALKIFASLSWKDMARGLVALAGSLIIIAGALQLMPPSAIFSAGALIGVGIALTILSEALKKFGKMSWTEIARDLTVLAGSLLIIVVALNAMSGALSGAAALLIVSGALAVLVPVLGLLGQMSWDTIIKGLTALAGIFLILGVAGVVLSGVTPVILGLAVAVVLIGAGMALAGAGALAFATAFGILATVGQAAVVVLAAIIKTFVSAIPGIIQGFATGLVTLAKALYTAAPILAAAFGQTLLAILNLIITNAPKIANAFLAILKAMLKVIVTAAPAIASAALQLLLGMLTALSSNIYRIVAVVANLITRFINALGDKLPSVIAAGVQFIIKFVNGLSDAIDKNSKEFGEAAGRLGVSIVEGMVKGIEGASGQVLDAVKKLAKGALKTAAGWLGIHSPSREFHKLGMYSAQGLALGLNDYAGTVSDSAEGVAKVALNKVRDTLANISSTVSDGLSTTPVIAPVIDLTEVRKGAAQMSSLLAANPISANVSLNQATAVSADTNATLQAQQEAAAAPPQVTELKFEQTNNSPEALSTAEIYRRTNNQLSLAKAALKLPA